MHLLPLILLTLLPLTYTTTTPSPPLHTATLHQQPCSPSPPPRTPDPLALLTYHPTHPHLSTLLSFTPPQNTTDPSSLTSIIAYLPNNTTDLSSDRYRSSATATYGFHAPYTGRFRVLVDGTGGVVGASWHAHGISGDGGREGTGQGGKGRGDFDILTVKSAPAVVVEKEGKGKGGGGAGGGVKGEEGEEEVEKTFLQKYWWLLLGVAVLALSGGGGEK